MVGSSRIDLHSLTLDELTGVVNLYPWYGGARVELSRRVVRMGGDTESFADEALYVPDRGIIARLLRGKNQPDCSDKDLQAILEKFLTPSAPEEENPHQVHVVGGDYFSQSQYDKVRQGGDSIFSRIAGKASTGADPDAEDAAAMADRYPTETLARIFAEQGRTEEAKRIYSRLVLDIPEKSAYFASLIDKLEE